MWLFVLPAVFSLLDATDPPTPAAPDVERRWGVEAGPLWAAVGNFIRPKVTFTSWARGDLAGDILVAGLWRVPKQTDNGEIFEVGVEIGYRQHFWRGLNAEVSALVMRSRVDSSIDGARYVGLNVFVAGAIGWRADLRLRRVTLYALPQIGVGRDIVRTDPPPTPGGLELVLVGEILAGLRF